MTERAIAARQPEVVVPRWVHPTAAVACGGLVAAVFGLTDRPAEIPAMTGFVVALLVLGIVDLFTLQLPKEIVWVTLAWGVVTLAPIALADGEPERIARAAAGAGVAALVVWGLRLLTRGGIGFGDVRLALPLGWFLTWQSWGTLGRAGVLAVVVNGAVSAVLLVTGRAGRRTKVPLGPSLVVGTLAAVLLA